MNRTRSTRSRTSAHSKNWALWAFGLFSSYPLHGGPLSGNAHSCPQSGPPNSLRRSFPSLRAARTQGERTSEPSQRRGHSGEPGNPTWPGRAAHSQGGLVCAKMAEHAHTHTSHMCWRFADTFVQHMQINMLIHMSTHIHRLIPRTFVGASQTHLMFVREHL